MSSSDINLSIARAQYEIAALRLRVGLLRLRLKLIGYDPSQPRIPRGEPGGGQWTDGDGSGGIGEDARLSLVSDDRRPDIISLAEEEAKGGHTIRDHVGKTDFELTERIRREQARSWGYSSGRRRAGSFESLESANNYINRIMENNSSEINKFVKRDVDEDLWITERFGFKTGREARGDNGIEPYLRDTYSVGVLLRLDPRSSRGYRVHTAYPRND